MRRRKRKKRNVFECVWILKKKWRLGGEKDVNALGFSATLSLSKTLLLSNSSFTTTVTFEYRGFFL